MCRRKYKVTDLETNKEMVLDNEFIMSPKDICTIGFLKDFARFVPSCIFHDITGVPCLTCGGTRSAVALSQFDILSSFLNNPLVPLFAAGLFVFSTLISIGYVLNKNAELILSTTEKKLIRYSVFAIIGVNWLFLILSGR